MVSVYCVVPEVGQFTRELPSYVCFSSFSEPACIDIEKMKT